MDNDEITSHPPHERLRPNECENIISLARFAFTATLLNCMGCRGGEMTANLLEEVGKEIFTGVSFAAALTLTMFIRDRISWSRRENKAKLQVSMSSIQNKRIVMHKLTEGKMEEILGAERFISNILLKHCKYTTDDDALVCVPEQFRERTEAALKTIVVKLLQDPHDIMAIHRGEAEAEEVNFWAVFTFERYGLKRNLIPRLIIVPEEDLKVDPLDRGVERKQGDHKYLRVLTHKTMFNDIHSADGPKACFQIKITRAKRLPKLSQISVDNDYAQAIMS